VVAAVRAARADRIDLREGATVISTAVRRPLRWTPRPGSALVSRLKQESFAGFQLNREGSPMKYVISWFERPQGTPLEYENAQKRILEVFGQWKAPANFKVEFFVVRVGEWGGHMLVDCDDPLTVHKFCSMLPAFVFEARPVISVEEAVRGELDVIAWRDGLKGKS
jgi:hypothetical protein